MSIIETVRTPEGKLVRRTHGLYRHQVQGLEWVGEYPIIGMTGGVQDGKSTWAILALALYITAIFPAPPPDVERTLWTVLPDRKKYWLPLKPKIEYLLGWANREPGGLILDRNLSNPSYTLKGKDGRPWELYIVSANDPDTLRAATVCAAWMTEAGKCDEEVLDNVLSRLAMRDGPLFIDSSPFGLNWLWRRILCKASITADYKHSPALITKNAVGDSRIAVLRGISTDHNLAIPRKRLDEMRKGASRDIVKREYDGDFFAWSGLIWKAFDPMRHVSKAPFTDLELEGATWIAAIDFGWGHPTAHLWIAVHRGDSEADTRFLIVDEYRESGRSLKTIADELRGNALASNVTERYADPSNPLAIEQMEDYGVGCVPAENDVELGLNAVAQAFEQDKILISPKCLKLVLEIGNYHRDEKTGKPVKEQDDLADCLRYGIYTYKVRGAGPLPYAEESQQDGRLIIRGDDEKLAEQYERDYPPTSEDVTTWEDQGKEIV